MTRPRSRRRLRLSRRRSSPVVNAVTRAAIAAVIEQQRAVDDPASRPVRAPAEGAGEDRAGRPPRPAEDPASCHLHDGVDLAEARRTPRRRSSITPIPCLAIAARTSGASATRSTSFCASSLSRTLSQTRFAVSLSRNRSVAFAAVSLSSARSTFRVHGTIEAQTPRHAASAAETGARRRLEQRADGAIGRRIHPRRGVRTLVRGVRLRCGGSCLHACEQTSE